MNDPAVALAVASALEALPALEGVAVYAHFDRVIEGVADPMKPGEEIVLPAVFIESKSEPLAGSLTIARALVQVTIESQVDDETPSVHNARAKVVADRFGSVPALVTYFNLRGLKLCGRPAPTASDPEIETHAMKAVYTFAFGYKTT